MKQILNEIRNSVEYKLGNRYKVSHKEQQKNNGVIRQGIVITNIDNNTISPMIYVDEYVKHIRCGAMTASYVADSIISLYNFSRKNHIQSVRLMLENKQAVLGNVVYRLINTKMNFSKLSIIPHKNFLDLSVEYRLVFTSPEGEHMSTTINHELCEKLGITEEELDKSARCNTCAGGFEKKSIAEIAEEIMGISMPCKDSMSMLVYTKKDHMYGASVMLYPQEFRDFAKKVHDDLFIFPSSIHEVIAVPASDISDVSKYALQSMVREINISEVADDEVLSENVYHYNIETGEITII